MAKLGDVCEILDSKRIPITASERKEGPYPYYGANGVQGYVEGYIFDDELVLLAEDGGNFGSKEKPIAYRVSGKCWVNNHAHVLKPKQGLDVDYLCYSLMFYDVTGLVNGATRQKLTQTDMRKMEILLRPLNEQRRIASILDKVTDLTAKRRAQLEKLDLLIKSRFVEMFGDPINNDKKWNTTLLNAVCEGIGDGLHGTPEYDNDGRFPFINGNNLINGKICITNTTKCIGVEEYKRLFIKLNKNAILLSINGTLGKVAFYNGEQIALGKSVCYCNLNNFVNRNFVYVLMKSESFTQFMEKVATKSTIKNVGLKSIREFKIILPPLDLQNKFSLYFEQTETTKFKIQQSLETLETLKKALIQDYFKL